LDSSTTHYGTLCFKTEEISREGCKKCRNRQKRSDAIFDNRVGKWCKYPADESGREQGGQPRGFDVDGAFEYGDGQVSMFSIIAFALPDSYLRSAAGVLVSDPQSRDIKMDQFTLSFHGRLLIEGAEISLNYGNRYGLLGENGSGKVGIFVDAQIASG
jgi:hypothetical protein